MEKDNESTESKYSSHCFVGPKKEIKIYVQEIKNPSDKKSEKTFHVWCENEEGQIIKQSHWGMFFEAIQEAMSYVEKYGGKKKK